MRFWLPLVLGVASAVTACALFTNLDGYSGQSPPASTSPAGDGEGDGGGPSIVTADGSSPVGPVLTDAGADATSASGAFSLGVTPGMVFLDPGQQNVPLSVTVSRTGSFAAPVTVSINGLPSAVHANSLTLTASDSTGTVNLGADANAVAGAAGITVLGVAGTDSASIPIALFVTGVVQTLTAAGTVTFASPIPPLVDFYAWGGGGAGGGINPSSGNTTPFRGGAGGAGGLAAGRVATSAGASFAVKVATGGALANGAGGSGGGYSVVARGATLLLVGPGGGGGGSGYAETNASDGTPGGAGGGATGANGGGLGGTSNAGGAADLCGSSCNGTAPSAGSSLLGGAGGSEGPGMSMSGGSPGGGPSIVRLPSGGGGGGGWFGGGGGGFKIVDPAYIIYHGDGGGGGSGHLDPSVTPIGAGLFRGSGTNPPTPAFYRPGVAVGGIGAINDNATAATPGGPGCVVVVLAKP